jgi:hypothetical protein
MGWGEKDASFTAHLPSAAQASARCEAVSDAVGFLHTIHRYYYDYDESYIAINEFKSQL